MAELENKTYKFYDSIYKICDKTIKFYGNIDFDTTHKLPILGFGSKSTVYKLRIGSKFYAIKIFNGERKEILENYESKAKIHIDSYISPLRIAYLNDKFAGYLMECCNGKNLAERKLNISVEEFARSSIKLFNDTRDLSLQKYQIFDTYLTNIMYDNGFKMIDMDDYYEKKDKSVEQIIEINENRLNQILSDVFVKNTGLASYMFDNIELQKLINDCKNGKIPFEELFNQVCTMVCKNLGEKIDTVSDIGRVLKKSKVMNFSNINPKNFYEN